MKRIYALCLVALISVQAVLSARERYTVRFGGVEREFYLSVPESPEPVPLIICTHGHGKPGKAVRYCPELETAALEAGFAICYPQALVEPDGKAAGWNVGYPFQKGMKCDDVEFMCFLAKYISKNFGIDAGNCFLTGMSNGGELCYLTAYRRPDFFNAIASIAGLQLNWIWDRYRLKRAVPFIEVHGTGDVTSRWEGDPDNRYGWGEYLPVTVAVSNIVSLNRCTFYEKKELPLLHEDSNRVILHHYTGGTDDSEVLFYEVVGGNHSWAMKDMDTCSELITFFNRHRK